jgi:hypothetical protein
MSAINILALLKDYMSKPVVWWFLNKLWYLSRNAVKRLLVAITFKKKKKIKLNGCSLKIFLFRKEILNTE